MKTTLFCVALLTLLAGPATADSLELWGVRTGLTKDNNFDQFFVGAHAAFGQPFPHIDFRPSVELGFGDSTTFLAVNGDLFYDFSELATPEWAFRAGAGLALNYYDFESGDSHNDLGLNVAGQVQRSLDNGNQAFVEIRLGIEDSPDFKLALGLNFL